MQCCSYFTGEGWSVLWAHWARTYEKPLIQRNYSRPNKHSHKMVFLFSLFFKILHSFWQVNLFGYDTADNIAWFLLWLLNYREVVIAEGKLMTGPKSWWFGALPHAEVFVFVMGVWMSGCLHPCWEHKLACCPRIVWILMQRSDSD